MKNVSKWEVAGVPAALVFEALYELGILERLGSTAADLPRVMLLVFVVIALVRGWTAKGADGGAAKS